jgi:hypothetical protein
MQNQFVFFFVGWLVSLLHWRNLMRRKRWTKGSQVDFPFHEHGRLSAHDGFDVPYSGGKSLSNKYERKSPCAILGLLDTGLVSTHRFMSILN